MERISDIWYVTVDELVNTCNLPFGTIRKGYTRKSPLWQNIEYPGPKSAKKVQWIRYDTMGSEYQAIVRKVLCAGLEPWEVVAKKTAQVVAVQSLPELVEQACKDGFRRYCGLYPIEDTSMSARKTQTCLARAAAVVELIGYYIQDRGIKDSSYQPYKEVLEWLDQDGNYDFYFPKGNQYLPKNAIRLKEKVVLRFGAKSADPQPIQEVIRLPREGNKSRDKFAGDPELMAWLAMARNDGRNNTNELIIREIQRVCQVVGREVASASWFRGVFASGKMQYMTADGRFGKGSKLAGAYNPYISMARAMNAGDCWMIDATRVNTIEHQSARGGKSYDFLTSIAVRDAYSGHILGVHFDTKEDRWGYVNALKMAVKSTGYLPHTLVYDRFPGHLTDEMQSVLDSFERKGVQLICTHKATGKALLERWWDTLQTVFYANSPYYYGQGIQSTRKYAHRSAEYLVKIRKEAHALGWNFDKAWQDAWQRIEQYVQTPVSAYSKKNKNLHLSPLQLHEQSEKPNVIPVELWDQASLFWNTKIIKIDRTRIEHEVHGVKYRYQIYDKEILYRYNQVAIRYEETDPSKIMLFSVIDGKAGDFYIGELEETTDIIMYGPDAETGRLAGRTEKLKKLKESIKADLEATVNAATMAPEYLLNMSLHIPKAEQESVQTAIIYEQMGATIAVDAQLPAKHRKDKPVKVVAPPPDAPFDAAAFVNQSFYNQ